MLAFEQYASAGVSLDLQHAATACREQQAAKHRPQVVCVSALRTLFCTIGDLHLV